MLPFKYPAKGLVLWAVLLAGLVICAPYLNDQDFLSQGDHGRDLYAAEAVWRGELPYRDFWWVYGPLTPYYYGLFYKIFGTKISSILIGKSLLRIAAGCLMALAMMEIVSPAVSLLAACWFMLFQQDFFFTYNHIAGIVMVIGVIFCLLSYIRTVSSKAAWGALIFTFVLCLIKINFGIVALVMSVLTFAVCGQNPQRKYFYAASCLLPLVMFAIYWSLLHGLSTMEIRECLPYKEGDQPYSTSPWVAIANFFNITFRTMASTWMNLAFAAIINGSALRCLYLLVKGLLPGRQNFLVTLAFLCLFWVLNWHEYLKSGVWYRGFWAQPVNMMIMFLLIGTALQSLPHVVRKILLTFIAYLALSGWFSGMQAANALKVPGQYLHLPRGAVYVRNGPLWISTVEETTEFLQKTLKPDQLFFALPYDCLYYYLTGKKTPTRQLIFFEHIKIPPEQEQSVIAELEKNHVDYVLLSSRAFARQELGLGFLGRTYCPLIGKYLAGHFVPIARFGDWSHEPGWAWNHGTMILKRK